MPESERGTDRLGRRARRFLSPSQKDEIWLQLVRQETTIAEAAERLEDHAPGGHPVHGLLDWEVAEIVALFQRWGESDRSHRKLAHRGS
jgi:hypothetical protein